HPDLAFRIDFPTGWASQNQPTAVVAVSQQQDAIVALSIPGKDAPDQALAAFLGQQGIQSANRTSGSLNGFPAAAADFQAQTDQGPVAGRITFVSYGGNTYQILGYTTAQNFGNYRNTFVGVTQSFNRLTDQAALAKQPMRIRLVRLTRDLTVADFYRQYPSVVPVETVAIINGVDGPTDVLKSGTTAKRVQ
ncbi:MAG: peptidase M48, partial [Gemmatimonadales bacterium]